MPDALPVPRELIEARNPRHKTLRERFEAKVHRPSVDGCWIWRGATRRGYGQIGIRREDGTWFMSSAHRVAWELEYEPIPEVLGKYHGVCVCHKCDNRLCVNPTHLFLGLHSDNMSDKAKKGRAARVMLCGERGPSAKLRNADIAKIRSMSGRVSQSQIARLFGVTQPTISAIVNYKTWRDDDA